MFEIHYPAQIREMGPLLSVWTARPDFKHRGIQFYYHKLINSHNYEMSTMKFSFIHLTETFVI